MLVLDSGGVSRLSARPKPALSLIGALKAQELWPPVVPTMVLVEFLQGDPRCDANTHRFLKMCIIEPAVSESTARLAARCGAGVDDLSGIAEDLYVSCLTLMYTSSHGCCRDGTQSPPRSMDRRCA